MQAFGPGLRLCVVPAPQRVRELAAERGYQLAACYAYSDSVTDLPMLAAIGRPHAVNPDRALRRLAQQRGWPVLTFRERPTAGH